MRPAVVAGVLLIGLLSTSCGGDDEPELSPECQQLKPVITACFDDWCAGQSTPFCSCWNKGMELLVGPCTCTPWDWELECKLHRNFDCEMAKATLADVDKSCQ